MQTCDICGCETTTDPTHLNVYAFGSEGMRVCVECNRHICNFARTLRQVATLARLEAIRQRKGTK